MNKGNGYSLKKIKKERCKNHLFIMALKKTNKLAIMFPPEPKTKEIKIIHMQTKFAESFAIFACLEKKHIALPNSALARHG